MAVISLKCPNCDGELIFDPSTKKYKCEYCTSLFTQEELDAMNQMGTEEEQAEKTPAKGQQKETAEQEESVQEAAVYQCPNCGAEIVTDATTAASFCYYCHNPVVLGGRLSGEYLPDRIIPFSVTKEAALKGFEGYIGKKKFVPRAFFSKKQVESMSGVYFPYWMYDTQMKGSMQAEGRNVRVWRTGDTEYTETKHYRVEREGKIKLENLTENALQKANYKLAQGMMPYDFSKLEPFQMGYLSGFLAERRDVEKEQVAPKMKQEMEEDAKRLFRETISGYNSVTVNSSSFQPQKEKWSYVLLPVWTLTYKARNGKIYYYSMNGQTGRVYGELPVDHKKLGLVSAVSALATLILALIGGFFL